MLLSLSDISNLLGLGIQITAMMKGCGISLYHFRIMATLGFLSSVPHILTVVVLRDTFVKKRCTNLPRVILMLGNLVLVAYTFFAAYSYATADLHLSMSMACFFNAERTLNTALVGRWAALMTAAIVTHLSVILSMYILHPPNETEKKKKILWKIGAGFRTWVIAPTYSIYGIYMAGTGLAYTQALGGTPNVSIKGSERVWGFGKLLPVLLLILPILAGWESFWGEENGDTKKKSKKREYRIEKAMIGSPIPKTSQESESSLEGKGYLSVDSTSPIYTPYSISPSNDSSEEEKRTENNGSSPEVPQTYHLSAFKDFEGGGRPGTIVEEAHTREPLAAHTPRERTSTSRRSPHFSYPNRAPPRSSQARLSQARLSQARLSQARLSQFQKNNTDQPVLCAYCESLPRESRYLGTDPQRVSRRSSHRRSQTTNPASYVPL
jgi:hypothetical protein